MLGKGKGQAEDGVGWGLLGCLGDRWRQQDTKWGLYDSASCINSTRHDSAGLILPRLSHLDSLSLLSRRPPHARAACGIFQWVLGLYWASIPVGNRKCVDGG